MNNTDKFKFALRKLREYKSQAKYFKRAYNMSATMSEKVENKNHFAVAYKYYVMQLHMIINRNTPKLY